MPVYVEKDINSDLAPAWPNAVAFDKEMSAGAGIDGSVVVSLAGSQTKSGGFITSAGVPNSDQWEDGGTWTVEIEADVGNHQITARCRCVRLDSVGAILQSGAFTATQTLDASRTFSPVAPAWTNGEEDCDNRIAIEVEFIENQGKANSVTIGLGTTPANDVTTDIVENTAGCVTVSSTDWLVQHPSPILLVPQGQGSLAFLRVVGLSEIPIGWLVPHPDPVISPRTINAEGATLVEDFAAAPISPVGLQPPVGEVPEVVHVVRPRVVSY